MTLKPNRKLNETCYLALVCSHGSGVIGPQMETEGMHALYGALDCFGLQQ